MKRKNKKQNNGNNNQANIECQSGRIRSQFASFVYVGSNIFEREQNESIRSVYYNVDLSLERDANKERETKIIVRIRKRSMQRIDEEEKLFFSHFNRLM